MNSLLMGIAYQYLFPKLAKRLNSAGINWVEILNGMGNQPSMDNSQTYSSGEARIIATALADVKSLDGSVCVNLGTRFTGKTVLAHRIAKFYGRKTYAVSPQQKPPPWIEWIKLSELKYAVAPMTTLILDDLPAYASSRDYNDELVAELEAIIPMVRHKPTQPGQVGQVHLIFNSQSAAQADKYILDCDLAFMKPLGLLAHDMERPNIRRIYRQLVDPLFEGRDNRWIHRHAYMVSRSFKGLITYNKS